MGGFSDPGSEGKNGFGDIQEEMVVRMGARKMSMGWVRRVLILDIDHSFVHFSGVHLSTISSPSFKTDHGFGFKTEFPTTLGPASVRTRTRGES